MDIDPLDSIDQTPTILVDGQTHRLTNLPDSPAYPYAGRTRGDRRKGCPHWNPRDGMIGTPWTRAGEPKSCMCDETHGWDSETYEPILTAWLSERLTAFERAYYLGQISIPETATFGRLTARLKSGEQLDSQDGDDFASHALAATARRLGENDPPELLNEAGDLDLRKFRNYVYSAIKNRSQDVGLRKKRSDEHIPPWEQAPPWESDDEGSYWSSEPPTPEYLPENLSDDRVTQLRGLLSDREFEALELVFRGFSRTDAADVMGLSASTVRSLMARVRAKFSSIVNVDAQASNSVVNIEDVRERRSHPSSAEGTVNGSVHR